MLYAFFWVIPRRLNFICRRFGTLCLFRLHRQVGACLPMKMEQSVPKRRHINFRRRGITQKKAYNFLSVRKQICDLKQPFLEFFSTSGYKNYNTYIYIYIYRVIHKSLRDFQPLLYSSRDGHAEGEHVNKGRDTPSFCPTLQVLDMCKLGDAADVNPVIKFLRHALQHLVVDSSDCLHDPLSQMS